MPTINITHISLANIEHSIAAFVTDKGHELNSAFHADLTELTEFLKLHHGKTLTADAVAEKGTAETPKPDAVEQAGAAQEPNGSLAASTPAAAPAAADEKAEAAAT